jgi:hypothetical protein
MWEFESLPPLGCFDPSQGFRPDFPSLLMFDEFVVDAEADEILRNTNGKRPWLGQWPDLLKALRSEGVITLADVAAAAACKPQKRAAMLKHDLKDPSRW